MIAPWLNAGTEIVTSAVASTALAVTTSRPGSRSSSVEASSVTSESASAGVDQTSTAGKSSPSIKSGTISITSVMPGTTGRTALNKTSGSSSITGSALSQPTGGANSNSVWEVLAGGLFVVALLRLM